MNLVVVVKLVKVDGERATLVLKTVEGERVKEFTPKTISAGQTLELDWRDDDQIPA